MTEIVFVWWLIFQIGTVPVPYQDLAQCEAAAEVAGAPKGQYVCVQQPRSDLKEWNTHQSSPYHGGYDD